jgi:hypothetical protein
MKFLFYIGHIQLLLALCGCPSRPQDDIGRFLTMGAQEQEQEFARADFDKQINIHVAAMTKVHPPVPIFARMVPCNPSNADSAISAAVRRSKGEFELAAICLLIEDMYTRCNTTLSQDLTRLIASRARQLTITSAKADCARIQAILEER